MWNCEVFQTNIIFQALNKKDHKGGLGSPDGCGGIDSDGEDIGGPTNTTLTPRTEEKYNRIDVEFQNMMHRNLINGRGTVSNYNWYKFFESYQLMFYSKIINNYHTATLFYVHFQSLQTFSTMPVTVPVNAGGNSAHFSASSGGSTADIGGNHSPGHPPSTASSLQIPGSPMGAQHLTSTTPSSPRPTSSSG